MQPRIYLIGATLTLGACFSGTKAPRTDTQPLTTIALEADPTPAQPPPPARGADDAEALVKTFVVRDGKAERLKSHPWFDSIAAVSNHRRPDSLQIIQNFKIAAFAQQSDTARVIVEFTVLGAIERIADTVHVLKTRFTRYNVKQSAVFVVLRGSDGWRVLDAPRTMRVFAAAYLNDPTLPQLTTEDRKRLERSLDPQ